MNAEYYRWNGEFWEFEQFEGGWLRSVWLAGETEDAGARKIGADPHACVVEYVP